MLGRVDPKDWGGRDFIAFRESGPGSAGIPRWSQYRAYGMPTKPMATGARYFPPEPDYDAVTDVAIPLAKGDIYSGGRKAYQEAVYKAAKSRWHHLGMKKEDVDVLKAGISE